MYVWSLIRLAAIDISRKIDDVRIKFNSAID